MAAATTFTPAAGVEIMILFIATGNAAFYYGFRNPAAANDTQAYTTTTNVSSPYSKFGITNSSYFVGGGGVNGLRGFSGIQIK